MSSGSLTLQNNQAQSRTLGKTLLGGRHHGPVTLSRAIWAFVAIGMIACTFGVLTFVKDQHRAYQADALSRAVSVRLDGVETDFARALDSSWDQLAFLAQHYDAQSPEARRAAFDAVVGNGAQISWVGFATPGGIVTTASGGRLEGQSVAQGPWFRQGLDESFAGDVHQTALLQHVSQGQDGASLHVLDLARPVFDANGQTIGVICMHIDFAWVEAFLKRSAAALGLDVYLLNETGDVVLATDDVIYKDLNLATVARAKTGLEGSALETWPDGEVYFTSVLPSISYKDLPNFGWRMLGRINVSEFALAETNLMQNALKFVLGLGVALVLMTALFVRVFVVPFSQLARNAQSIAAGEAVYPYDGGQTAEIAQLSAALSLMQWRQAPESNA